MTTKELAKKNYDRNLWTPEMLEKLKAKGLLTAANITEIKANKDKKQHQSKSRLD